MESTLDTVNGWPYQPDDGFRKLPRKSTPTVFDDEDEPLAEQEGELDFN